MFIRVNVRWPATMRRWVNGFWEAPAWLIAILLLVNALSALNLTRVFRLVFLGEPQAKTRRAPEVPWPMAVPMVSAIVITLLVPVMLQQWQLLLSWTGPSAESGQLLNQIAVPLLVMSGAIGCFVGFKIRLRRAWARPMQKSLRLIQDVCAYDFYIEKLYRVTVVGGVEMLSKITNWFDRYVVDGAVNLAALVTVFSGQSLKYSVSGQSQVYVLTIMIGVGLLVMFSWMFGQW